MNKTHKQPQPEVYPETYAGMYEHLVERLHDVVPDVELRIKAELSIEINRLKKEKNAVILGHNYMEPTLYHSVSDYTGDSLGLCRVAAQTGAEIIVFCGVRFMAETAKIINPEKLVLLPSEKAGCSLADSITAEEVRGLRKLHPGVPIVTYVNTYADVKAECDYCCTSGNATQMVRHLLDQGHQQLIFIPDEFLSANTAREVGIDITYAKRGTDGPVAAEIPKKSEQLMIGWKGRCEVHEQFTVDDVTNARAQFPDVSVLAHPECGPDVVEASDFSGSTSQMIKHVKEMNAGRYLLLTECSMGDNIVASNPAAEMIQMCSVRCPHMNQITLEETLASLREERFAIDVDRDIRERAKLSIDRMLQIS